MADTIIRIIITIIYAIHAVVSIITWAKISHWKKSPGVDFLSLLFLLTAIGNTVKAIGVSIFWHIAVDTVYFASILIGQATITAPSIALALYLIGIVDGHEEK